MKNKIGIHTRLVCGLTACLFLCLCQTALVMAQEQKLPTIQLSLEQAIEIAKTRNKIVESTRFEKLAADEDFKDAKASMLPIVGIAGNYQRFSKLTLYTHGLSETRSIPKNPGPNGADLGLSASFSLFSGGRTRAFQQEQEYRLALAEVSIGEISANISLQVAAQYLELIRLGSQKRLISDQIIRSEARVKNIEALYRNQKVTRSDVLRAELVLSNTKLLQEQVLNDITIANTKLNVLLNLPGNQGLILSDTLKGVRLDNKQLEMMVNTAPAGAYGIQKFKENFKILGSRIKGLRSNYYPSVSIFSAYGINYPNTIFFPPVDQAYSIGFVGLKVQYNLSSLYHNKHKVSAANVRMKQLALQQSALSDNISQEASGLALKYKEVSNRIKVVHQQIEQTSVNYKIVSSKYFNQLALLTDLLDADNLYQEARYNLIQAEALLKLLDYRLRFTSGKL